MAPICLSLEDVTLRASNEVLMDIGNNILLIVGDPTMFLYQQLRPHTVQLLNITNKIQIILN
jgi:hypothetical protein